MHQIYYSWTFRDSVLTSMLTNSEAEVLATSLFVTFLHRNRGRVSVNSDNSVNSTNQILKQILKPSYMELAETQETHEQNSPPHPRLVHSNWRSREIEHRHWAWIRLWTDIQYCLCWIAELQNCLVFITPLKNRSFDFLALHSFSPLFGPFETQRHSFSPLFGPFETQRHHS